MKEKILVVEDESQIARFLTLELEHEGYEPIWSADGAEGLHKALTEEYAIIILDIMLPSLNGIEVLRRLRQVKSTPVIILTARDQVVDKVNGLDIGADDYMTKPFAIEELLARIRTHIKKSDGNTGAVSVGALQLNDISHIVTYDSRNIELTKKEYDLLKYLMQHKNQVVSREKLLDDVWGFEFYGNTNVVDVYVRYLRSKIDDVYGVKMIETVRGTGYVIRG